MQNPLELIEKGCDDLCVVKDVIVLADLPSDEIVFYLCSQIVKSITRSGVQGSFLCHFNIIENLCMCGLVYFVVCTGYFHLKVFHFNASVDISIIKKN